MTDQSDFTQVTSDLEALRKRIAEGDWALEEPKTHLPSPELNGRAYVDWKAPIDPVRQVIIEIEDILTRKGKDYASHGDTFINFSQAADLAGITVEEGMMYRIGEKLERLKSLRMNAGDPQFESIEDTLKDLVGYFILLIAWKRQEKDAQ